MYYGVWSVKAVCPFCGAKYSVSKRKAESIETLSRIRYGYDPVDREKNILVWPCSAHTSRFEVVMKKLREKQELARREYEKEVARRVRRLKSQVFRATERLVKKELEKLGDGEGLLVWVSDGFERDGEYRDLVVAYVREGGEVKKVYSDLKPSVSYTKGKTFSATHYIAQDLEILLYNYQNIRWKGIIQGLVLDNSLTRRIIEAVFSMTHSRPKASLLDFISYPEGLGSSVIREAKATAKKVKSIYALSEPHRIREEVERRIEEKYGVPIGLITPSHLLRFIEERIVEEKEEVSN